MYVIGTNLWARAGEVRGSTRRALRCSVGSGSRQRPRDKASTTNTPVLNISTDQIGSCTVELLEVNNLLPRERSQSGFIYGPDQCSRSSNLDNGTKDPGNRQAGRRISS